MAGKDYYKILGIKRDASQQEVKQAYRKLARQHHPDVNPGDKTAEARFKEINEAHEVLSDKKKRKQYDKYGDQWQHGEEFEKAQQQTPQWEFAGGGSPGGIHFGGGGIESIFEEILGGGTGRGFYRRQQASRGQDLETSVDISLEEAYQGTRRTISLQAEEPCPTCRGTGRVQNVVCATCRGTGTSSGVKRLEVKIPPGAANGSRIRVAGKGQSGYGGGAPGDLFLVISVTKHGIFERHGDNLHVDVPVPLTMAVLGGEVQVPTLKGRLALKIPAETANGKVFRLAGQGMPHLGGSSRGDILAKANVAMPTKLSQKEKELFEQLRELRPS